MSFFFFSFCLFISVLYFYLQLFYEFESLQRNNSEKKSIPDFKIRKYPKILTIKFGNNNPDKGIFERKKKCPREFHRVEKVTLIYWCLKAKWAQPD